MALLGSFFEDYGSSILDLHDEDQPTITPMVRNEMRLTDEDTVVKVYSLGRDLATVLEECHIHYW